MFTLFFEIWNKYTIKQIIKNANTISKCTEYFESKYQFKYNSKNTKTLSLKFVIFEKVK